MARGLRGALLLAVLGLVACGGDSEGDPVGSVRDLGGAGDAGRTPDSAADAGGARDAAADAAVAPDLGAVRDLAAGADAQAADAAAGSDGGGDVGLGGDTGRGGPSDLGSATVDLGEGELPECYGADVVEDLPERVVLRSATTSFNRQWFVALRAGRIWVKPNTDAGEAAGDWRLLGSGLPEGGGLSRFLPPEEVVEISADGTWLHALSAAGVFYRGTDFTGGLGLGFTWSDSWGHPAAGGPGITTQFPVTHGWSVSDSQRSGVDHYEDRLGTVHSVGMGVAHLYRVGADGRSLVFNDWWLPADWSRQICLPERGTVFAENLSVSASTIFLVGALGELYTRIYDFDTSGENDTLEYSYLITEATGQVRSLPPEAWRRQPDIAEGLITRRISIHQDGQGNAARVLRVEGVQGGRTGFYEKRIFDERWRFEETGARVCGPFLNAPGRTPPPPVRPNDEALVGTLERRPTFGEAVVVSIEIADFNLMCSPATATLRVNGQAVTVAGEPLEFPLHHAHALTLEQRDRDYWLQGVPARVRGALLVPAAVAQIDDDTARATVLSLFQDRRVVNLQGTATPNELTLDEMTWLDPLVGVVPGNEKADPGNAMRLRASGE